MTKLLVLLPILALSLIAGPCSADSGSPVGLFTGQTADYRGSVNGIRPGTIVLLVNPDASAQIALRINGSDEEKFEFSSDDDYISGNNVKLQLRHAEDCTLSLLGHMIDENEMNGSYTLGCDGSSYVVPFSISRYSAH